MKEEKSKAFGHRDHRFLDDIPGIVIGQACFDGDAIKELPVGIKEVAQPSWSSQFLRRLSRLLRVGRNSSAAVCCELQFTSYTITGSTGIFHGSFLLLCASLSWWFKQVVSPQRHGMGPPFPGLTPCQIMCEVAESKF